MISKAKSSQSTMALSCSQAKQWVKTHYECHEDGVVAKAVMYKHYEDYCRDNSRSTMETSIFGRVVKSVFPDVTIRRLGGRDNLKYYYCGIQAKESSPYAIDNTTTTRPKRRLRKRELVTEKTEVHNCLRWLHAYYTTSLESSVVKTEVYEGYVKYCAARGVEPLSIQYFGMVVTHAFPGLTKRKLGPRTNQQKFYFGIKERANPLSPEMVSRDMLNDIAVDQVLNRGRHTYREGLDTGDEDEEYGCRSPASDLSDIPPRVDQDYGLPGRLPMDAQMQAYALGQGSIKEEPVDYSLSSLKLKDEPPEDEPILKEEPLDLHISRDSSERRTPDRPPSVATPYGSNSPSPPVKDMKKKLYKPRFHYSYHEDTSWNSEADFKNENFFDDSHNVLTFWIEQNVEPCKGMHVNREQLYGFYEQYCEILGHSVLPLTHFDETVIKELRGVTTMIHPSGKTYYEGINVNVNSPMWGKIEEFASHEDSSWSSTPHSMEMSPADGCHSRESPLALDEEDEEEEHDASDEEFGERFSSYNAADDDLHSTQEVLRDGKFYLRQWLTDNFETVPDACVLKADAYRHYENYAKSINQTPFEMNVFGKIVRQVFPTVTIRRLGGRVKPQYHYCGIAVKPTSPLFPYMSGRDPAQRSRKKEIATDNISAETVIDWLRKNYECSKEKTIAKSEVYNSYTSYCNALGIIPVRTNYFGKLVKYCFPSVEARKFGGRNEPIWYYFGLGPSSGEVRQEYPVCQVSSYRGQQSDIPMHESQHRIVSPHTASPLNETELRQNLTTSPIPIALSRNPPLLGVTPSLGSYGESSSPLHNVGIHGHPFPQSPFPGQHSKGLHQQLPRETFGEIASRVVYVSQVDAFNANSNSPTLVHSLAPHMVVRSRYPPHSPADFPSQKEHLNMSQSAGDRRLFSHSPLEAVYPKEQMLPSRCHVTMATSGGQVVPCPTPLSYSMNNAASDQAVSLILRKHKHFPSHEDFELFGDLE